jgi:MarR family transcriptional regulator, transcriptional regulator for hemolysin
MEWRVVNDQVSSGAGEFGRRLYRLGQNWRRQIDQDMRQFGLTDATWRPLYYLGRFGDGMRQTDLAVALDIEGPSLVRLLDALERQGLVERLGDADDRRVKTTRMTEAGRVLYEQVAAVYNRISQQMLGDVSEADIAACHRAFEQVEAALSRLQPASPSQES